MVFMEELHPKSHTSDVRTSVSSMHENIGTGSRYSGLMSQNLKYEAVEEENLFVEELESGTVWQH